MTTTVAKSDTPEMFDEIAHRYDLLNHVLSLNIDRGWRRRLVDLAGVPAGGAVMDACTGTADVAIQFARQTEVGDIVGVDRSSGMLRIGDGKLSRGGHHQRIRLIESDVLRLPFEDGVFDAVTIAFGLRNLPDYQSGVTEMSRVLKPGGKLLVLEFCPPSGGLHLKAYQFYLRRVMPVIGAAVSGSTRAYRYLASSIGDFITADDIRRLMHDASLRDFEAHKLTGGIAFIYCGTK